MWKAGLNLGPLVELWVLSFSEPSRLSKPVTFGTGGSLSRTWYSPIRQSRLSASLRDPPISDPQHSTISTIATPGSTPRFCGWISYHACTASILPTQLSLRP